MQSQKKQGLNGEVSGRSLLSDTVSYCTWAKKQPIDQCIFQITRFSFDSQQTRNAVPDGSALSYCLAAMGV